MGKYTWLIVLGIIAWQVIAGAVQQAAKKQKQERMAEAVRQRARAAQAGGPGGPTPSGGDLAARRKAQLDELRRRRATRTGTTTVRTPGAPPVATPTVAAPVRVVPAPAKGIETVAVGYDALRSSEVAIQRRKELEVQRARAEEELRTRQRSAEVRSTADASTRRRRTARRDALTAAIPAATSEEPDAYSRRRAEGPLDRLRAILGNRATLRDLVVLREILDPPVGMRTQGELD